MNSLSELTLDPNNILFDPNNYRFIDLDGFIKASEDRFADNTVQSKAYNRMRQEDSLLELKKSILRNGYIPVERLVVRPFAPNREKYIVIEGNRRLAAIKWILDDYAAGVNIQQSILESLRNLPVVVAESDAPNEVFRASLMGIRHVSGIKQWGGYQRAKLVTMMRDDLQLDAAEVAERVGMSTQEVNRRYKAFKALQQMQEDENYGDHVKPSMYPLFHEAVSLPIVREWLGWSDGHQAFENTETLEQFYTLLIPQEREESPPIEPKITTYLQVRELRSILPKPEAKHLLLDPSVPLQDAINLARQEEMSKIWLSEVSSAIGALEIMNIRDLKALSEDDVSMLNKLKDVVQERLNDYATFKNQ